MTAWLALLALGAPEYKAIPEGSLALPVVTPYFWMYSAADLEKRVQGDIVLSYDAGPDGRISTCQPDAVAADLQALARESCRIWQRRARIETPSNPFGLPMKVSGRVLFSWRVPEVITEPSVRHEVIPIYFGPGLSSEDYPAYARRNQEQGAVVAEVEVDAGGRVSGCRITGSSGSPTLDATTCILLFGRYRFLPPLKEGGKIIGDRFEQRINWTLPR